MHGFHPAHERTGRETPLQQAKGDIDERETLPKQVLGNGEESDMSTTQDPTGTCHVGSMNLNLTEHDQGNPANQAIIGQSGAMMYDSQPRAMNYFDIMD